MRITAAFLAGMLIAAPAAAYAASSDEPADAEVPAADAGDRAARLNALFETLQTTDDAAEGKRAERAVWRIWLQSGDEDVDVLMGLAMIAMRGRNYQQALSFLDKVVQTKPDFAEGWNKRATVHFLVKDYAHSIADIARTLALEPRHFGALSGLGMIMERLDRPQKAKAAYREALAVNPNLTGVEIALRELEARIGKDI